jgi:anti-anti-sigma factor
MRAGLDIIRQGEVAVAAFRSACISDVEEIAIASTQLQEYIESDPPSRMVFDFAGVEFLSPQVLGLLLQARARLESWQGEVAISSLSPQLLRVFQITGLDRIFQFYPDRAAAASDPSVA